MTRDYIDVLNRILEDLIAELVQGLTSIYILIWNSNCNNIKYIWNDQCYLIHVVKSWLSISIVFDSFYTFCVLNVSEYLLLVAYMLSTTSTRKDVIDQVI